jgi:hypothetical protein
MSESIKLAADTSPDSVLNKAIEATQKSAVLMTDRGFVPQDLEACWRLATVYLRSGLAPKGMDTVEKLVVAIEMGIAVGMTASQAIQSVAIINGRPTVWGDMAKALCAASPVCEWITEVVEGTGDNMTATCTAKRKDWDEPIVARFSITDAKRAGLSGKSGPWKDYPPRMLQMRARSFCLRDAFPDVLKGIQCREEVEDYKELSGHRSRVSASDIDVSQIGIYRAPEEAADQFPDTVSYSIGDGGVPMATLMNEAA